MRGEKVLEFNLNPQIFKTLKYQQFDYKGQKIPIVSEGWEKIKNFYFLRVIREDKENLIIDLTYKLYDNRIRHRDI
jgi:hypothetical protein